MLQPLIFIALLTVALCFLVWFVRHKLQKRSLEFAATTASLGMQPVEVIDVEDALATFDFPDLIRFHVANASQGLIEDRQIHLFDLEQVLAYGHTTKSFDQTVVMWRSDLDVPAFRIEPINLGYRLRRSDEDEDVEKLWPKAFAKAFSLTTSDPKSLSFPDQVFEYFMQHRNASLYHLGDRWLYFERNVVLAPDQVSSLTQKPEELEALFQRKAS